MTKFIQPDIIYLQPGEWPEVTWCVDKINSNDVEYLRATPERKAAPQMFEALTEIATRPVGWYGTVQTAQAAIELATGDNDD